MQMEEVTAQSPPIPSPDQPVPDEFDLVCEHCGYSLVGLTSNRCPECGEEFDPSGLPLARVAWLFRKRLGTLGAYRDTVMAIIKGPKTFAKELCRPVRICISDARAFRKMSVRLAVLSVVLGGIITAVVAIPWAMLLSPRASLGPRDWQALIIGTLLIPIALALVGLLFRLATDLPTFIWKGLEQNPIDLAPLHHYASAPLALMLLLIIPYAISAVLIRIGADDLWTYASAALFDVCVFSILLLLWFIPLRFMKQATGCGFGRVLMLAVYLPLHWFLMLLFCTLIFAVACVGAAKVVEFLAP